MRCAKRGEKDVRPETRNPRPGTLKQSVRATALLILAGLCLCFTGCGANLKYRVSPKKEYAYTRTVTLGEIGPDGKPVYLTTPRSHRILVKSYLKRNMREGWIRVTTPTESGRPTVYGDKNLGQKDILLNTKGNIVETKGDNRSFFFMDLFFHLPQGRINSGGSWTSQQYVELNRTIGVPGAPRQEGAPSQFMTLPFAESLSIRYTYAGNAACGTRRCARIKVKAVYSDTKNYQEIALARLDYNRTGDILFLLKQGRVYSAVYEDMISFQAINNLDNTVVYENTHAQKIEYSLEK